MGGGGCVYIYECVWRVYCAWVGDVGDLWGR